LAGSLVFPAMLLARLVEHAPEPQALLDWVADGRSLDL
jgi:hypothetical protein